MQNPPTELRKNNPPKQYCNGKLLKDQFRGLRHAIKSCSSRINRFRPYLNAPLCNPCNKGADTKRFTKALGVQSKAWLERYFTISQDDSCVFRGQRPTLRRLSVVYHLLYHRTRTHSYLWVLRSSFYQLVITMVELEILRKDFIPCFMWIDLICGWCTARW